LDKNTSICIEISTRGLTDALLPEGHMCTKNGVYYVNQSIQQM